MAQQTPGQVGWLDLTVPDADMLREFYSNVIGWTASPVAMGEYNDFMMNAPGVSEPVAGVCHARGGNAGLPPVWMPYFIVADVENSLAEALARGAATIKPLANMGEHGKWCIVRDPAGAHFGLFQTVTAPSASE